jgi:hypothetical protein
MPLTVTATRLGVPDMAKRNKKQDGEKTSKKGTKWEDRREYLSGLSIARDLAGWIRKITNDESKRLPEGRLSIAELIDAEFREWAWQRVRPLLEKELGQELADEAPPPPGPFAVPDGSGGWTPAHRR